MLRPRTRAPRSRSGAGKKYSPATPLPEAPPAPPAPSPKRCSAPHAARSRSRSSGSLRPSQKAAPAPSPKPAKTKLRGCPSKYRPQRNLRSTSMPFRSASPRLRARISSKIGRRQKGPTQRETALQTRPDVGSRVCRANDVAGLLRQQLLQRLWNTNCDADGGDTVVVPVRFTLDSDGRVVGGVTAGGQETSSDPVVFAAARRAN